MDVTKVGEPDYIGGDGDHGDGGGDDDHGGGDGDHGDGGGDGDDGGGDGDHGDGGGDGDLQQGLQLTAYEGNRRY